MPVKNYMFCYCLPFSFCFWRETTNLASIDVLSCAHPEFCVHFGTVLGLLYIHISHMRIDLIDAILFFFVLAAGLNSWPTTG